MTVLTGTITKNLTPFFEDAKGAIKGTAWLAFMGQGGGSIMYEPDADYVEYEIQRGSRRMAQLVKRTDVTNRLLGKNQKNLGLGEYTQVARALPLSIEEYDISASLLRKKLPGEASSNSGITAQDRLVYRAAKGQIELLKQQVRLINYLAGQGILTGKQDAIIGTTNNDEKYDFYRDPSLSVTLGTPWGTNASSATPLKDLDNLIDDMIDKGGSVPEFGLFGDAAVSAMFNTDEFKSFADIRGFQPFLSVGNGVTAPAKFSRMVENGWECRGYINTWKGRQLWIFQTEERVEVTAGTVERSMPSNKVVLGNSEARVDGVFGPGETLPETESKRQEYIELFGFSPEDSPLADVSPIRGIITPEMFYLDAYTNAGFTNVTLRSQTAPLIVPVATDEWGVLENAGA